MADQKISQLDIATSSLADDNLVIQRGLDNLSLAVGLISTGGGDTGSFVTTSSISGTTQTFTKGDGSTYINEIVSASFAVSASYAVSSSVEITKEVSSSYADTASYFNTDPISASLTTTDQTISSSVASLSGSASTARENLKSELEITGTDGQTIRFNGTSPEANSVLYNDGTNIGIGSNNPEELVEIRRLVSAGNDNFALQLTNPLTTLDSRIGILFADNTNTGANRDGAAIQVSNSNVNGRGHLTFGPVQNMTMTEVMRITQDQKVGIGTDTPSTKLEVDGTGKFGGQLDMSTNKITNVVDPTAAQDAATKNYVDSLSGSASTARNAIASDLTSQSSSFASDRVMRAGDTMTGALTISETGNALVIGDATTSADTHIIVERNFARSGSIKFTRDESDDQRTDAIIEVDENESLQIKYNQSGDVNNRSFRIINDTTNVMEVTGTGTDVAFNGKLTNVTNPTASQDVATKNYADNLVYTVPVMFSGNGSGSSGDYSAGSKIAFSVDVDTNSAWSDDTYTIPEDGVYEIITSLRTRIETDDRRSAIFKGTGHIRIIENPQGATGGAYRSRTGVGHIITSLVTGDTISVGAFQTTTNYPNIGENGLSIRKLRN